MTPPDRSRCHSDAAPVGPEVAPEPAPWPRRRFLLLVALLVAAQLGLILLFSDRTPLVPRQPAPLPRFVLAPAGAMESHLANQFTTGDPALLGLVSPNGFSGPAWLALPSPTHELRPWAEPLRWLALEPGALGAALQQVMREGGRVPTPAVEKPGPKLLSLELPPAPLPTHSTLRIEGDLAARALVTPVELPDWPSSEVLTNSVVQVAVHASGEVLFATLLSVRGLKGADQRAADARAVTLARSARFQPRSSLGPDSPTSAAGAALDWGTMVFHWHTLPLPASPAAATAQAASTP